MIVLMLYSALVALIFAAAARAADWLARLAGYHVRWIWAGALALTMFLSVSAARQGTRPADPPNAVLSTVALRAAAHTPSWSRALSVRIEKFRRVLDVPLRSAVATVYRFVPPTANVYAASLSSVISLGLLLVIVGVGRRFRSARRKWPLVTVQGVDVRLAPRIGPVVIGLVHPEIVVPRWLLGRHADDQRLIVTHEDEHVRARDPLLLGLAWCTVILAPWNPAVWYMISRLRLAIELDCDARVLRRGAVPRSYGSLLIDVAQHAAPLRLNVVALVDDSSHLRQRILAMKPTVPRFARLRGGLAGMFALASVLIALLATLPAHAEIGRMKDAAATSLTPNKAPFKGVVFIDGVRTSYSQIKALDRTQIEQVEILKGRAAAEHYGAADAARGVILITTKRAESTK